MIIDIENIQELTRLSNDWSLPQWWRDSFITRGADNDRRTGTLWVIANRLDGTKRCSTAAIGICGWYTIIAPNFLVWRVNASSYFLRNWTHTTIWLQYATYNYIIICVARKLIFFVTSSLRKQKKVDAVKGLRMPRCAYASLIDLFFGKEKLNRTYIVLSHST